MAWYKQGTVALVNGNAVVNGTGTAWTANTQPGDAFVAPDGKNYEIQQVNSDTQLTLAKPYGGSTASGANYAIQPTSDYVRTLAAQVSALVNYYKALAYPLTAPGAFVTDAQYVSIDPALGIGAGLDSALSYFKEAAKPIQGLGTPGQALVGLDTTGTIVQVSLPQALGTTSSPQFADVNLRHIIASGSAAPTLYATGAGAGSGAGLSVVVGGSDTLVTLDITVGATAPSGTNPLAICQIAFGTPFAAPPKVIPIPVSVYAMGVNGAATTACVPANVTTAGFKVLSGNTSPLVAGRQYSFVFLVIAQ